MEKTSVVKEPMGGVSLARAGLNKAVSNALTPSESILLRGQLAILAARVARLNARVGRRVVDLSPYAKMLKDPVGSAVV